MPEEFLDIVSENNELAGVPKLIFKIRPYLKHISLSTGIYGSGAR